MSDKKNCPVNSGHAIETALNFLEETDPDTAEKALRLLGERDPQLAETLREGLKNRSEPMSLLRLHPSFWTGEIIRHSSRALTPNTRRVRTEKSFLRWQALKRNSDYADWALKTFSENADFFRGKSFLNRYFTDYPPEPKETFSQWRSRIIDKTKRESRDDIKLELQARKVVWSKNSKGLPARWLPVPAEIDFPHPYAIKLLSVELCVSPVHLPGTTKIIVLGRPLWIDLLCWKQQIIRDILSLDLFLGIDSKAQRDQAKLEAKKQLEIAYLHRPRSTTPKRRRTRKRDPAPPRPALMFTAWDMKRVGGSYRDIAASLWRDEYAKAVNRGTLRDMDGNRGLLRHRE
jgi:hypothetical protein